MGRYDDDEYDATASEKDDDIEQDEAPKKGSKSSSSEDKGFDENAARKQIARGWGKAEQVKAASSAFADKFTPTAERTLIHFLEDEPYTSYRYHWLEDRDGQKSFTCIDDMHPKGCPLCAAGSKASSQFCFNVAVYIDGDWVNKSYQGGSRLFDALKTFHQDETTGPLSRHYWSVNKSGKKGSTTTNHNMVKARDLEEDYGARPINDEEAAALEKGKYDASIVFIPKRETLVEVASEELGD